jgi:hypothetical protein
MLLSSRPLHFHLAHDVAKVCSGYVMSPDHTPKQKGRGYGEGGSVRIRLETASHGVSARRLASIYTIADLEILTHSCLCATCK